MPHCRQGGARLERPNGHGVWTRCSRRSRCRLRERDERSAELLGRKDDCSPQACAVHAFRRNLGLFRHVNVSTHLRAVVGTGRRCLPSFPRLGLDRNGWRARALSSFRYHRATSPRLRWSADISDRPRVVVAPSRRLAPGTSRARSFVVPSLLAFVRCRRLVRPLRRAEQHPSLRADWGQLPRAPREHQGVLGVPVDAVDRNGCGVRIFSRDSDRLASPLSRVREPARDPRRLGRRRVVALIAAAVSA
mmetsp:Transcript_345/g.1054  ORF Transcript_345/g.1054 Transcript_345/m.1054 type:complete len:248 (+) Transcript_345:911-1654(+)